MGKISLGGEIHRNILALPLDFDGETCITAFGMCGETIFMRGSGARQIVFGERKYVEEFSGLKGV